MADYALAHDSDYNCSMFHEIEMGDVVQMRKPHPCGGYTWQIVRVGLDIGIVCQTCQRKVLLPRSKFNKRVKKVIGR